MPPWARLASIAGLGVWAGWWACNWWRLLAKAIDDGLRWQ